jgi:hypothetical protein
MGCHIAHGAQCFLETNSDFSQNPNISRTNPRFPNISRTYPGQRVNIRAHSLNLPASFRLSTVSDNGTWTMRSVIDRPESFSRLTTATCRAISSRRSFSVGGSPLAGRGRIRFNCQRTLSTIAPLGAKVGACRAAPSLGAKRFTRPQSCTTRLPVKQYLHN